MAEFIQWATLAYELGQVPDLNIELAILTGGGGDEMDGSPFTITLTNVRDDGYRDHMLLTLTDQDEGRVIPRMTEFMGYPPFCKYSYDPPIHKDVTVTYEWDCRDPEGRFNDIESGKKVKIACNLTRLEDGFKIKKCTCPKTCDCENPPPDDWDGKSGVYHISNSCPIHNDKPYPDPECPIHGAVDQ